MQVSSTSEMGRANKKETQRNEFGNKYLGRKKNKADSSFSTALHPLRQFYYHVAAEISCGWLL